MPNNIYSVGNLVESINKTFNNHVYLGPPKHNYDFTQTEEWANKHGYFPDKRGHRDDRVKKETHPTHPNRGVWNGMFEFHLSDRGLEDINHTLFGMYDGGLDPQATLYYNLGIVLPEITVTPKESYIHNPYDNIKYNYTDLFLSNIFSKILK